MTHVYPYEESLITALANFIVNTITKALQTQDRFTLALSGGTTPKALYKKLAAPAWSNAIPWEKVHIFWGDERYLPYNDEHNNAKMAFDVLLNKINIPKFNIHRMRTDIDIERSAGEYESTLRSYFKADKTFDMVLLGIGEDGHTLSIFPGSSLVIEEKKWVAAVTDVEPKRITLTPAVVNRAINVIFLVSGKNKSAIYNELTADTEKPTYPAQFIKPASGQLFWFISEDVKTSQKNETFINRIIPRNLFNIM